MNEPGFSIYKESLVKKMVLLATALVATTAFAKTDKKAAAAKPAAMKVDVATSTITWKAEKKVASGHTGTIALKSGEVMMDKEKLVSGKLVADMTTIKVTDIPAGSEDNGKLTGHLNSDDFFATKNNSTAELTIKSAKETAPGKYEVTGDLKIKGITKPVTFPVTVEKKDGAYKATGTVTVDRTLYNIKYNSEVLGVQIPVDRIIKDQFTLNFDVTAKM